MSTSKTIAKSISNDTNMHLQILQHENTMKKKHSRRTRRQQASKAAVSAASALAVCALSLQVPPTVQGFSTARMHHHHLHLHLQLHTDNPMKWNRQSKSKSRSMRMETDVSYKSHDNPDEQQCQHEEATSRISNTNNGTNANVNVNSSDNDTTRRSSPTLPDQQQQQQQQQPKHHVSSVIHTLWTSSKSRRAKKQAAEYEKSRREQLILDNYLESIDKRYKRLHKRQAKTSSTNNAWQWLMNGTANREDLCAMEEQRKMEDGIYVLGLAELASKQLLQRHHLPIPQSRKYDSSTVIDIEGMSLSTTSSTRTTTTKAYAKEEKKDVGDASKQPSETVVASSTDVSLSKFDLARSPLSIMLSFFHLLKGLQAAYVARINVLSGKALETLKVAGRAMGTSLAKTANFLTMNGGGAKHTFHLATFLAMFVVTTASYALRPITKA